MYKIATVAVDGAAYHYDKKYTYIIPTRLESLQAGCRVRVSFGRGNQKRLAIVLGLAFQEQKEGLKPILELLDPHPILEEEGLKLLFYLKEHTFCTWFDALRLLIPAGLGIIFTTLYIAAKSPPGNLAPWQEKAVAYLKKQRKPMPAEKLSAALDISVGELDTLVELGAFERVEYSRNQVLDDKVVMIRLLDGWENIKLTPKQKKAALFLAENESASVKELCYYTGVTHTVIQALRDKGAAIFYDHPLPRNPYSGVEALPSSLPIVLSEGQQTAFEKLAALLEPQPGTSPRPALLYGVTGSGKTQVYMALIDRVLESGRTAIVLVPEISLTAQTLETFHARFGSRVAVLHSGLSLGERTDEWRRIRDGGADIVVGTRSAVFAPLKNLGLIVIDEEQEHTYKSDKSPRFHARDVAQLRCGFHGAMLVLTSATPSVESYHAAVSGRCTLVRLPERFGHGELPSVQIIDMQDAQNHSDTPSLSLALREELHYNLTHGEQSILLLNRRGHSTLVRCSSCGYIADCPFCSVAMTYHAANNALLCHYCGHRVQRTEKCAVCGSELVRYSGAGTQKLEQELAAVFPDARILRVDTDTTMSKFSHQRLFRAFADGEYDIMVGTQMVAKGLNFPKVTLVGVLNTDQSLYSNDFRSFERTFALLTQVVGRCGRGEQGGRALIQTYSPENPIILLAATQDYPAFFLDEDHSRKIHLYPPYCAMAGIGFTGEDQSAVLEAAHAFLTEFRNLASREYAGLPLRMLGPAPADVLRAAGRYRYKLILKCKNSQRTRALLKTLLEWFCSHIKQVGIFIDMYYDSI